MKKWIALLLAAMMLLGGTAFADDSRSIELELTHAVIEIVEPEPEGWYETSSNRALLTALLLLDYLNTTDDDANEFNIYDSYVSTFETEGYLMYSVVVNHGDDETLVIVYCPELDVALYSMFDRPIDNVIATEINVGSFTANLSDDVTEVLDELATFVSNQ